MLRKDTILGVEVTNASSDEVLEYFLNILKQNSEKRYIVTPNPEIIVYANKHPLYKKILNSATLALPDGMGVMLAGILLGKPFKERLTGVDFMEKVCRISAKQAVSIGLLGGKDYVAERAAECLRIKYPGVNIVFSASEWGGLSVVKEPACDPELVEGETRVDGVIKHQQMDILFVAFGHPKQEEWISKNLENIPVKVAMGVGGALDYLSGDTSRAPKWLRNLGFEWLYRLVYQPWRWRRQVALLEFIKLVISERVTSFFTSKA